MKRVFSLLAFAAAVIFTTSCTKDESLQKSSLQSLSGTVWTGSATEDNLTVNYTFTFGTDLNITVEVAGLSEQISASYSYDNPIVRYQDKSGSGNTGEGLVSADGKTMNIYGVLILTLQTESSVTPAE